MVVPAKVEYSNLMTRSSISKNPYYYSNNFKTSYPISENAAFILRRLFNTLIEGEVNAERFRRNLNSKLYFSCYDNFELIKNKSLNYASSEDVNEFMTYHGYSLTNFELNLLFRRLDRSRDHQLSFNEFAEEINANTY